MKKIFKRALLLATALSLGANCFALSACDTPAGPHEHIYGGWTVLSAATCTENGARTHTCAICKETEEEEIPALGHDFNGGRETVAASCTQTGKRTQTCRRCQLTVETDVPTVAHNWNEGKIDPEPTCKQEGSKTLTCKDCGATLTGSLGYGAHDPVETGRKAATCTAAGSISYRCNTCGETLDDVEIPALGHRWKLGDNDVEPTCTEDGYLDRVCERCGTSEKKTLSSLGHELPSEYTLDKLPTFEAEGSKSQHCLRCGEHVNATTVPKLDENVPVEYSFRLLRNSGALLSDPSVVITVYDGDTVVAQSAPSTLVSGVFKYSLKPLKDRQYTVQATSLPKGYTAEPVTVEAGDPNCNIYLTAAPIREPVPAGNRYSVGSVMYDFTLSSAITTTRESYSLSGLLGKKKAVVLNFWATWCGPCQQEFPYLQLAYTELKDDIELLAINQDISDNIESVEQFASRYGYTFPMAYDSVNRLQSMFGVTDIPATVVIDSEGVVCELHNEMITSSEQFISLVSPYLTEKTQAGTPAVTRVPDVLFQKRTLLGE